MGGDIKAYPGSPENVAPAQRSENGCEQKNVIPLFLVETTFIWALCLVILLGSLTGWSSAGSWVGLYPILCFLAAVLTLAGRGGAVFSVLNILAALVFLGITSLQRGFWK